MKSRFKCIIDFSKIELKLRLHSRKDGPPPVNWSQAHKKYFAFLQMNGIHVIGQKNEIR